jgi:hypothetical protein
LVASSAVSSREAAPISTVPSVALFTPTPEPPPWITTLILELMAINELASFSATGWTVVEPASLIVPDSSPGLVGVEVGFEVVGFGFVVVGAEVVGVFVLGVGLEVACEQPVSAIARTSTIATGNISNLIFFIIIINSSF